MPTLNMCLFLEQECDLRPGGRSWAALGAYVGGLGPLLESMLAFLFAILASVGGLGPPLELMLAVLSRSWILRWRSGATLVVYVRDHAALGVYVGNLGLGERLVISEGPDRREAQSRFVLCMIIMMMMILIIMLIYIYVYTLELAYRFETI